MPNHAVATYRLALTLEKMGKLGDARANYAAYLKILPRGPYAADARKALQRLQATASNGSTKPGVRNQRGGR
jgi:TolA-binding protein